mgnify:CR=1
MPPSVAPLAVRATVPPRVRPSGAADRIRPVLPAIPIADRWQKPLAGLPDTLWGCQGRPKS